ncbi:antibiotic biosynthesis monooxygenase [Shewanella sp. 202IG2-18]|uniref:putative quinol monooxygenase n=1 Tax=Parashewanella hymeniacidonis TaxID=2807618 RepID=UPI001960FCCC|nr:antibiotic biosynthesis monooxygenase [Parashewanella hymeniacidonis]MBM7071854.1 antibiotic biosynthesis monooxygenase [Parashewanella hymeniacidonis]
MLSQQGVRVTAVIEINADQDIQSVLSNIQLYCQQMESEDGCLFAQASQNAQSPREIILWEIYQDEDAIEAHFNMPHTQAFINSKQTSFIKGYQSHLVGGAV